MVQGNYVGTDITGTIALGNGGQGVFVDSQGDLIGGALPGAGNVIAANGYRDVLIQNATGTVVQGNYIGVDKTGNVPLSNPIPGSGLMLTLPIRTFTSAALRPVRGT